jgi:hypothetical protein
MSRGQALNTEELVHAAIPMKHLTNKGWSKMTFTKIRNIGNKEEPNLEVIFFRCQCKIKWIQI